MINWREKLMDILRSVIEANASDLHLGAEVAPHIRVNGTIRATDYAPFSGEECRELLFSLMTEDEKRTYEETKTLDFSFGEPGLGRFRVNIYQQRGTIAAAIRLLPVEIIKIENLGLPVEPVKRFCSLSHGLVLICGPVGSGKTTTLASMIDYINKTRSCHIISIEDPIEYVHRNIKSLIHQREVKRDTPNFIDALRFILREDPDIVVIGEMRDVETIQTALTIAETGHLVFATLHTGDTSESIRRIIDVFATGQQAQVVAQLSYMLIGVINQMLLPTADNNGRVLASEVMVVTPAIQNLIRENKIEQIYSQLQIGTNFGMQTMSQSLSELVKKGLISPEFALLKTKREKELYKLLEKKHA
jgi:twitching motility protein PilT